MPDLLRVHPCSGSRRRSAVCRTEPSAWYRWRPCAPLPGGLRGRRVWPHRRSHRGGGVCGAPSPSTPPECLRPPLGPNRSPRTPPEAGGTAGPQGSGGATARLRVAARHCQPQWGNRAVVPEAPRDRWYEDRAPETPPEAAVPYATTKNPERDAGGVRANTIDTVTFTDGLKRVLQTKKDASVAPSPGTAPRPVMTVSGRLRFDFLGRTTSPAPSTTARGGARSSTTRTRAGPRRATTWPATSLRRFRATPPRSCSVFGSTGIRRSGPEGRGPHHGDQEPLRGAEERRADREPPEAIVDASGRPAAPRPPPPPGPRCLTRR